MKPSFSKHLDKRALQRAFNRVAPHYDQWASFQKRIGKNLLERLEWLKLKPNRILEAGAGTGHLTHDLNEYYPHAQIYAVDFALRMLHQARLHTPPQHFICADVLQLPVATGSIDLILSNLLLPWCDDIQAAFTECVRILRPNGVLLFSTLGPDTLKELRHSASQAQMTVSPYGLLDMHDIGDLLLHSGLRDVVTDVDWFTTTHKGIHELRQQLRQCGLRNFSQERPRGLMGRHKFHAMVANYEHYRSPQGVLPATVEVIYGYGIRKSAKTF